MKIKDYIVESRTLNILKAVRHKQSLMKYYARDLQNRVLFGPDTPRSFERLWINPYQCASWLPNKSLKPFTGYGPRKSTAMVLKEWPANDAQPITNLPKFKFCYKHWVEGMPWEQTGAFDYLITLIHENKRRIDNCRTPDDIRRRYTQLDDIFDRIKSDGAFQPQLALNKGNFREMGGVIIHVGPGGTLYFGKTGIHRLCIALTLNLYVPAVIGCIHHTAISHLPQLRAFKSGRPEILSPYDKWFNKD